MVYAYLDWDSVASSLLSLSILIRTVGGARPGRHSSLNPRRLVPVGFDYASTPPSLVSSAEALGYRDAPGGVSRGACLCVSTEFRRGSHQPTSGSFWHATVGHRAIGGGHSGNFILFSQRPGYSSTTRRASPPLCWLRVWAAAYWWVTWRPLSRRKPDDAFYLFDRLLHPECSVRLTSRWQFGLRGRSFFHGADYILFRWWLRMPSVRPSLCKPSRADRHGFTPGQWGAP